MSPDLKELLALLQSNDVRFLISGGHALAIHGHPRYTKDLDVWVASDSDNLGRLRASLRAFGFAEFADEALDLAEGRKMLQLGREPNRVDLLNFASGLKFDEAWPNRVQVEFEGLTLSFLGLEDLKRNKRAAGRLSDLADLERLGETIQPEEASAAVSKASRRRPDIKSDKE
ncbi:MAG: DUF6036 family nucleotidyltransferase [Lysobacterales bacterium]